MSWKNWNWKTYVAGVAVLGSLLTIGKGCQVDAQESKYIVENMPEKPQKLKDYYEVRDEFVMHAHDLKVWLGYMDRVWDENERGGFLDSLKQKVSDIKEPMDKLYEAAKQPEVAKYDSTVKALRSEAEKKHSHPYYLYGLVSLIASGAYALRRGIVEEENLEKRL